MIRIREAIIVEGRYDKNTLAQIVDAPILETSGFGIFHDSQRLALLRRLAEIARHHRPHGQRRGGLCHPQLSARGDRPGAGQARVYPGHVAGKERRKRRPGKEGKLGWRGCPLPSWRPPSARPAPTVRGEDSDPPKRPPSPRPTSTPAACCRGGGQPGKAAEAAAETGPAIPPLPQRYAPHPLRPVRPECPAGGDAEPVIPALVIQVTRNAKKTTKYMGEWGLQGPRWGVE